MVVRMPKDPKIVASLAEGFLEALGSVRGWASLPTLKDAKNVSKEILERDKGMRRVDVVCIMASGDVKLLSIGRKGGFIVKWNFGKAA